MSGTWFCLDCGYNMGTDKDVCPSCGYPKYGKNNKYAPDAESYDMARKALYREIPKVKSKKKEPMFTDLQKLMFGLYPKGFKEILKLKVFGKK